MNNQNHVSKTTKRVLRVLFTLALAGTVVFIFANSSQNGSASGAVSAVWTARLNAAMGGFGIGFSFTEGLVRKLGHVAEYALLGFWLMLTLRVYTKRLLAFVSWPLLGGLCCAVLDEFNQLRVPGRSGLVSDVVIDFGGVVAGLCAALFLQLLAGAVLRSVRERRAAHSSPA